MFHFSPMAMFDRIGRNGWNIRVYARHMAGTGPVQLIKCPVQCALDHHLSFNPLMRRGTMFPLASRACFVNSSHRYATSTPETAPTCLKNHELFIGFFSCRLAH